MMERVWCIRVMPLWAGSTYLHRRQGPPLAEPQTSCCDLAATPWHAFFWAAARFCHSLACSARVGYWAPAPACRLPPSLLTPCLHCDAHPGRFTPSDPSL